MHTHKQLANSETRMLPVESDSRIASRAYMDTGRLCSVCMCPIVIPCGIEFDGDDGHNGSTHVCIERERIAKGRR